MNLWYPSCGRQRSRCRDACCENQTSCDVNYHDFNVTLRDLVQLDEHSMLDRVDWEQELGLNNSSARETVCEQETNRPSSRPTPSPAPSPFPTAFPTPLWEKKGVGDKSLGVEGRRSDSNRQMHR